MVSQCGIINDLGPQRIRNAKVPYGDISKTGQLVQRVFREDPRPNGVKIGEPEMKQVDHSFDIDVHRLNAHLILETEERHLSRL